MESGRQENRISNLDKGTAGSPAADALPHVALGWLREVLRSEFAAEPDFRTEPLARSGDRGQRRSEWLRLLGRIEVLALTDPLTGLAAPGQLGVVLDHAWAIVEDGDPLTMVAIGLDRAEDGGAYERALCTAAKILRQETQSCGVTLRYTAYEFLLVLPHLDRPQAEALIARSRERLGEMGRIHAGFAHYTPEITSADQLLEAAGQALTTARR